MPPINQGARGTMIAWLVGTTVAAVAAIICAIYFYVESNRVAQGSDNLTKKYHEVVAEAALTGGDIADLKAKREDTAAGFNRNMSVLDIALKERDDIAARLAGAGATADKALAVSAKAIQTAADKAKEAGLPPPP